MYDAEKDGHECHLKSDTLPGLEEIRKLSDEDLEPLTSAMKRCMICLLLQDGDKALLDKAGGCFSDCDRVYCERNPAWAELKEQVLSSIKQQLEQRRMAARAQLN